MQKFSNSYHIADSVESLIRKKTSMQKFKFMVNQFSEWRKAKERKFSYLTDMKYFRVSTATWREVRSLIQLLVVARIDCGQRFVISLPSEVADSLVDFLEQMRYGYIHPRSSSHKSLMISETRTMCASIQLNPLT